MSCERRTLARLATLDSVLASTSIWASSMIRRLVSTAWTFTAACEFSPIGRRVGALADFEWDTDHFLGHDPASE